LPKNQRFFRARKRRVGKTSPHPKNIRGIYFPRAKIAKIEDFARYVQPPQKPRGDFTTRRNFDAPTRLA